MNRLKLVKASSSSSICITWFGQIQIIFFFLFFHCNKERKREKFIKINTQLYALTTLHRKLELQLSLSYRFVHTFSYTDRSPFIAVMGSIFGINKKDAFKIHVSHNAKWQQNAISFGGPNYCVVTGQAVVKCEWKRVKEKYSFYFFIYRFNAAKCFTNCIQTITYSTPSILIHKMNRKKTIDSKKKNRNKISDENNTLICRKHNRNTRQPPWLQTCQMKSNTSHVRAIY